MATKNNKNKRSGSRGGKKSARAARGASARKALRQQAQKYDSLHDLFILKLNSLHYIEKALVKALPKMAGAASAPELQEAFTLHLGETEGHVTRIERALESIGESPKRVEVAAIDGLVEDASWCIKTVKNPEVRDAILIAAAQYVENYERAGYGTAQEWALLMNHSEAADLLGATLKEEEAANNKLTELAEGGINDRANMMEGPVAM